MPLSPHQLSELEPGLKELMEQPGALAKLGIDEHQLEETQGSIATLLMEKIPPSARAELDLVERSGGSARNLSVATKDRLLRGEQIDDAVLLLEGQGIQVTEQNKRITKALIDKGEFTSISVVMANIDGTIGLREYVEKQEKPDVTMLLSLRSGRYEKGQNWDTEKKMWSWNEKLGLDLKEKGQKKLYESLEKNRLLDSAVKEGIDFKRMTPDQVRYAVDNVDSKDVMNEAMLKGLRHKRPDQQWFKGAFSDSVTKYHLDTSYEKGMKVFEMLENKGLLKRLPETFFNDLKNGHQFDFLLENVGEINRKMLDQLPNMKKGDVWYKGRFMGAGHSLDVKDKVAMKVFVGLLDSGQLSHLSVPFHQLTGDQVQYLASKRSEIIKEPGRLKKIHTYKSTDGWSGREYNQDFNTYDVHPKYPLQREAFARLKREGLLVPGMHFNRLMKDQVQYLAQRPGITREHVRHISEYSKGKEFCTLRKRFVGDIVRHKLGQLEPVGMRVYLDLQRKGLIEGMGRRAFGDLLKHQVMFLRANPEKITPSVMGQIHQVKEGDEVTPEGKIEHPLDKYGVDHHSSLSKNVAQKLVNEQRAQHLTVKLSTLSDGQLNYMKGRMGKMWPKEIGAIQDWKEGQEWNDKEGTFIEPEMEGREQVIKGQLKGLDKKLSKPQQVAQDTLDALKLDVPFEATELSRYQLEYFCAYKGKIGKDFVEGLRTLEVGGAWDEKSFQFLSKDQVEESAERAEKEKKGEKVYEAKELKEMRSSLVSDLGLDYTSAKLMVETVPELVELVIQGSDRGGDISYPLELALQKDPLLMNRMYEALSKNVPLQNRFLKFMVHQPELKGFMTEFQKKHPSSKMYSLSYPLRSYMMTEEDDMEAVREEYKDVDEMIEKAERGEERAEREEEGADGREPRVESREPRADGREPRVETREESIERREGGMEIRERGVEEALASLPSDSTGSGEKKEEEKSILRGATDGRDEELRNVESELLEADDVVDFEGAGDEVFEEVGLNSDEFAEPEGSRDLEDGSDGVLHESVLEDGVVEQELESLDTERDEVEGEDDEELEEFSKEVEEQEMGEMYDEEMSIDVEKQVEFGSGEMEEGERNEGTAESRELIEDGEDFEEDIENLDAEQEVDEVIVESSDIVNALDEGGEVIVEEQKEQEADLDMQDDEDAVDEEDDAEQEVEEVEAGEHEEVEEGDALERSSDAAEMVGEQGGGSLNLDQSAGRAGLSDLMDDSNLDEPFERMNGVEHIEDVRLDEKSVDGIHEGDEFTEELESDVKEGEVDVGDEEAEEDMNDEIYESDDFTDDLERVLEEDEAVEEETKGVDELEADGDDFVDAAVEDGESDREAVLRERFVSENDGLEDSEEMSDGNVEFPEMELVEEMDPLNERREEEEQFADDSTLERSVTPPIGREASKLPLGDITKQSLFTVDQELLKKEEDEKSQREVDEQQNKKRIEDEILDDVQRVDMQRRLESFVAPGVSEMLVQGLERLVAKGYGDVESILVALFAADYLERLRRERRDLLRLLEAIIREILEGRADVQEVGSLLGSVQKSGASSDPTLKALSNTVKKALEQSFFRRSDSAE